MNNAAEELPESEPMVKCYNCDQMIGKSKFRLHEMGCLRQNRVKQPSPKKQEEAKEEPKPVSIQQNVSNMNQKMPLLGQAKPIVPATNSRINQEMQARGNALQGSSLADAFGGPEPVAAKSESNQQLTNQASAAALNDYDQMIFQQFMGGEDGGQGLIRNESQQEADFGGLGLGGNQPSQPGVRQADQSRETQLIGGDDDMDPPFRGMGGSMQFFDPGTFGTLNGPGRQRNAPEGLGLQRQGVPQRQAVQQPSGRLTDQDVEQARIQSAQDMQHLQNIMQNSDEPLGGVGNPGGAGAAQQQNNNAMDDDPYGGMNAGDFMDMNDLPAEEMDMELQKILEMSRQFK